MDWQSQIDILGTCLHSMLVFDGVGQVLEPDLGFDRLCELSFEIQEKKRTIFFVGNGASASMASHVSADLAKNAHLHTEVFSDLALITAIANDLCYEEVYSEPLRRRMCPGDMLVAISSSGESENILRAAAVARDCGGKVVTLSAMERTNALCKAGILNFYIPSSTYGLSESCHAVVLHNWIDRMITATAV